jgi:hypothetical protein
VSPVKYELGFYILEDGILHSHRREDVISYIGTQKTVIVRRWKPLPEDTAEGSED